MREREREKARKRENDIGMMNAEMSEEEDRNIETRSRGRNNHYKRKERIVEGWNSGGRIEREQKRVRELER